MAKLEKRSLKSTEIRLSTGADGSDVLSGYAVIFNSPSVDLGGFTETCSPGMFTRTLRESPDVVMLRDHVSSQLLGRTTAGTLTLNQDSKGLAFTVTLPKTAIAADTVENVRNRNLSSCSFGFNVPQGGDKWSSNADGSVLRTLLDVNLAEISVTSFAAYPATSISLRSLPAAMRGLVTRASEDGCDCICGPCIEGDCEGCDMLDCEDEDCAESGCPNQDEDEDRSKVISPSEVLRMRMRLEISRRK